MLAWKAWGGWGKIVPPVSWLPLPRLFNLMMALSLVLTGSAYTTDAAVACLVAHHTYARGSEIDGLRVSDVVLPSDPRSLAKRFSVVFGKTKSGRPQTVNIDVRFIQALLRMQLRRVRKRAPRNFADGTAVLFDFGPGGLVPHFRQAQIAIGYHISVFVRHSERHGGATCDFMEGIRTAADISVRLRHANLKTTLIYLQDAQAQLLLRDVPPTVKATAHRLGGEAGIRLMIGRLLHIDLQHCQ
jgi:hypothetical protein